MTWRRLALVLAMMTVPLMAPSSAFGAAPNRLLDGAVTPGIGQVSTPFILSVHYRSSAGNAADAVTATAGPTTVSLSLTAGNAIDGTWSAVSLLPAGSWDVVFRAAAANGPDPTLRVGPVAVLTAQQSASATPIGSQPAYVAPPDSGGTSSAGPQPAGTQPAGASSSPATAPRATTAPSHGAAPAPTAAQAAPTRPGRRPGGRRSAVAEPSHSVNAGPLASPAAPKGDAMPPSSEWDPLGTVMLLGLTGVAAIALLGAAWLILTTRRQRPREIVGPTTPTDSVSRAIATIERRALRRARLGPSNDPILAAMGLPDEAPTDAEQQEPEPPRKPRRRGRSA
jgi:hypothetical protein